jgi:hypothetical protein
MNRLFNPTNSHARNVPEGKGQLSSLKKTTDSEKRDQSQLAVMNKFRADSEIGHGARNKFNSQEKYKKEVLLEACNKEKQNSQLSDASIRVDARFQNKKIDFEKMGQLQLIQHWMNELSKKSYVSLPDDIKIQGRKYPWLHSYPTKGSSHRISEYLDDLVAIFYPSKINKQSFQKNKKLFEDDIGPALQTMASELEKKLSKKENQESRKILESVRKAQAKLAIRFDDSAALEKSLPPSAQAAFTEDEFVKIFTLSAKMGSPKCTKLLVENLKKAQRCLDFPEICAHAILVAANKDIRKIILSEMKGELEDIPFFREFLKKIDKVSEKLRREEIVENYRAEGITSEILIALKTYDGENLYIGNVNKKYRKHIENVIDEIRYAN